MNDERMSMEEMAEEARRWTEGELPSEGLVDAPDAVPRVKESVSISIRLPRLMVEILKEFARRSGIGYQVLMKRWLDERIRQERTRFQQEQERLRRERERAQRPPTFRLASPTFLSQAAVFDASSITDLPIAEAKEGGADQTSPK
jgi:hypothetical protein